MDDKPLKILLIEDNPEDIVLIREILAQDESLTPRFHFEYAHRLDAGLEMIRKGGIDCVVLDLSLPDSRGLETLTRLQAQSSDVPVVVLTDDQDEGHGIEAVSRGAQDYLNKVHLNHYVFVRAVLHAVERAKIRTELNMVTNQLLSTNLRLEKLALLDPLTELLNRRGLQEALSREIQFATRDSSELIAVILDLDDFKQINDALGHAVGDVVLKEVAHKIKNTLKVTDYVARVGGDEFLALMPQTRLAEGIQAAQKLRLAISDLPIMLSLKEASKITASLGLVVVSDELVSIDELIAKAHQALDKSKKRGKNRLSYGSAHGEKDLDNPLSEIFASLRRGDRYRVVKQPIFNLLNGDMTGYEFLSRLEIEGYEMPDDFFRLCLENNILTIVDYHCLKNCIATGQKLPAGLRRHLNIFPSTVLDIADEIVKAFPKDAPRGSYCIEISEQQIIGDPAYLIEPVNRFKKQGILIAIDDVGFGRSCLESLIGLEPDVIKIDKRYVNGISKNIKSAQALKRILKVTDALGAEVVAEGIEQRDDLDILKDLGVKFGQGYLLGRPS
ncbi:MAG: hypothetical protein A3D28_00375 [Omnitrophica bacterium RIFCSPHIGHO2_02_FULL_63_14]|nr:MAG: hypothetical protein A3D28_00375 [Omnitrophica bacterium RIFCSPHIGHO2_02_FULL_63_14]